MRVLIHRYIAVSKDLERWLIGTVGVRPDKVRQIYNGVDHERFPSRRHCEARGTLLPAAPLAGPRVDGMAVGSLARWAG